MSEGWHGTCPHCQHKLHLHKLPSANARITCPLCRTAFTMPAVPAPPVPPRAKADSGLRKRLAAVLILLGGLLAAVIILVIVLSEDPNKPAASSSPSVAEIAAPSPAATHDPDTPKQPLATPPRKANTPAAPAPAVPQAPDLPKKSLPTPPRKAKTPVDDAPPPAANTVAEASPRPIKWLPPQEQARVNKAIARGIAWLRKTQRTDGAWAEKEDVGCGLAGGQTAIVGLALLASGVSAKDPSPVQAAAFLRRDYARTSTQPALVDWKDYTYALSLAILFLDRLGDPQDEKLIQRMTLRLLTGQMPTGCWGYYCRILTAEQERRLLAELEKRRPATAQGLFGDKAGQQALPAWARTEKVMGRRKSDHSNTQFAVMALWAAARHRLAVERALAQAARHFRANQLPDGGWSYELPPRGRYASFSMTAAGLYALAVGHGLTIPDRDQAIADPALSRGLKWLGRAIDNPHSMEDSLGLAEQGKQIVDYYCLWSVERTAMLYNLQTIDGRAWYSWGVKMLLAVQEPDGHWPEDGRGGGAWPSAAFALLFLSRADVAPELTRHLRYVELDGQAILRRTADLRLKHMFYQKSSGDLEHGLPAAVERR